MELEKVYIISTGDYSEYRIVKVFTDEKKAENYCKIFDDCYVEEWGITEDVDVSSQVDTLIKQGLYPFSYSIRFKILSNEIDYASPVTEYASRVGTEGALWRELDSLEGLEIHVYRDNASFYSQMYARDEEHALKIGRDHLAVAKAQYERII